MVKKAGSTGKTHARSAEVHGTAARIFHEKGYAATSIQEIADAVGILKGSLYYYMESKEDLLFHLIRDVHDDLLALRNGARSDGSVLDRLRALVKAHIAYVTENMVRVSVFLNDFRHLSPERQKVIIVERDRYERHIRDLLKEGQENGEVDPGLDPKLGALAVLGMLNWIHLWYRPTGEYSVEGLGDQFAAMAVAAVQAKRRTGGRTRPKK